MFGPSLLNKEKLIASKVTETIKLQVNIALGVRHSAELDVDKQCFGIIKNLSSIPNL